jgi:hypothetical protein
MNMTGIIFEGADASGKSTLARKVAEKSKRQLFLAGGAPKDSAEMWRMIDQQGSALEAGMLVDRVSSISQQIYRDNLWMHGDLIRVVHKLLEAGNIIVYCRPPDHVMLDPKYHVWKDYDTEDWKQNVLTNQATYMQRYDTLMAQMPCVIYDWTSEESTDIQSLLYEIDTPGVIDALRDLSRRKK